MRVDKEPVLLVITYYILESYYYCMHNCTIVPTYCINYEGAIYIHYIHLVTDHI